MHTLPHSMRAHLAHLVREVPQPPLQPLATQGPLVVLLRHPDSPNPNWQLHVSVPYSTRVADPSRPRRAPKARQLRHVPRRRSHRC